MLGLLRAGEEEEDDEDGNGTDWQVDEEAPSPGLIFLVSGLLSGAGWCVVLTALSVKTPPRRGPATEAIPYMPPMRPEYMGRLARGTEWARMSRAPEKTPADPMPATARPTMRVTEFCATPQMRLPSSKMQMASR
jgi:hypothetical protein